MINQFKYIGCMACALVVFPFVGHGTGTAQASVPTPLEYNMTVSDNKAAYSALKAKIDNVPAMIAARECVPEGSIVAGPVNTCPTTADLKALLAKQQAQEAAMREQMKVAVYVPPTAAPVTQTQTAVTSEPKPVVSTGGATCAPAGSITIGPVPACPTDPTPQVAAPPSTVVPETPPLVAAPSTPTTTIADLNALIAKNQAEYNHLQKEVASSAAMLAAGQCAPAGSITIGPLPACATAADLNKLLVKQKAEEAALKDKITVATTTPVPTTAEYNALVAKNQAEYNHLQKEVANSAAMLAAGQCAPAGSITIGPLPACATTADLNKLLVKQQAAEQAMKDKMTAVVATVVPTTADLTALITKNQAAYAQLQKEVANSAAMLAAGQCAPAGSITIGPLPACPTTADLTKLLASNLAAEQAMKDQMNLATGSAIVNVNTGVISDVKCAISGTIVAGPTPACPTTTTTATGTGISGGHGTSTVSTASIPKWATQ